jgi:hypothetical protein
MTFQRQHLRADDIALLLQIFDAVDLAARLAPGEDLEPIGVLGDHIADRVVAGVAELLPAPPPVLHVPGGQGNRYSDNQDWLDHCWRPGPPGSN